MSTGAPEIDETEGEQLPQAESASAIAKRLTKAAWDAEQQKAVKGTLTTRMTNSLNRLRTLLNDADIREAGSEDAAMEGGKFDALFKRVADVLETRKDAPSRPFSKSRSEIRTSESGQWYKE